MTKEKEGEKPTRAQLNLDGVPLTNKMTAHLECKHNRPDLIDQTRGISFFGTLKGNQGGVGSFNINLNGLSMAQYDDILKSLGIPELQGGTPLHLAIFRPEGELLSDWEKSHKPAKKEESKEE
ncbi:MAG: hypothetical protein KAT70_04285 [Thermoplasmata archaeon]|nr:hypothetical protein [Thermoplasmata archaeon]